MSFDKINPKCQFPGMKDISADPRQQVILAAAWAAFAAYGYRKTSMDDIARGAAMSRPALYLHYRNKQDIFRSLARFYYDQACQDVQAALARPGPAADVLAAAFAAQAGEVIEVMLTSPHGMELLDTTSVTAADIVQDGENRLREVYAAWLAEQAAAGRITLVGSVEEMAGTITAALKGIKSAGTDFATYKTRVAQLAAMIGAGLVAK
jgi:AcrR family transcriptional regulator